MSALLSLQSISKRFPGVLALDDIDMDLRQHEVLGLIGQNGSGKSTLMKIIGGLHQPSAGEMRLGGSPVRFGSPLEAARAGIGLVHQEQSLIGNLTVAENLFIDKPTDFSRFGFYRRTRMNDAARIQLDKVELDVAPDTPVDQLTFAQRQMVELAKVLSLEELVEGHLVVLFDEPTSVLTPTEIQALFRQVRRLKMRSSVVFISHRMDEVLSISDRVYVLSDGRNVAERVKGETDPDELYELMVGRQRAGSVLPRSNPPDKNAPKRLAVRDLTVPGKVEDVSFDVASGEIVGLIGVQGSGAEAVCRAIFGVEDSHSGHIEYEGRPVRVSCPSGAVGLGIGYVPAERKAEAMMKGMSVCQNMTVTFGSDYGYGGLLLSKRRERREAANWVERLKIKTPSLDHRIDQLSGGNQQKAVLSKWLLGRSLRLLVLDHPTRGLDPGARADLFNAIRRLAEEGLSIVFVGDTLDEMVTLSDTILVLRDGRLSQRFDDVQAKRPSEEDIVRAMV
ncbi:MAG: sugar ABC transporter ATP-binding protein [Mesorhizobium sp.]|uniref:sugar ABC transporter ATP-binding protein n=1 Tax=Mesorhizobium sp. TaxID=1871066 RepID=UPI000FE63410|nr:sugar ABC transporter ATP-binding protein [Mesorhizobium sp.]RWL93043.1 MAG: sugar ABC transporter ATP-binding protein [Mesorhizobium sp.]